MCDDIGHVRVLGRRLGAEARLAPVAFLLGLLPLEFHEGEVLLAAVLVLCVVLLLVVVLVSCFRFGLALALDWRLFLFLLFLVLVIAVPGAKGTPDYVLKGIGNLLAGLLVILIGVT